jgi:hypothetical protein
VAATYYEQAGDSGQFTYAIYDLTLGQRTAVYGPVPGSPLCYQYGDSSDTFTLLGAENHLVTVTP